MPEPTQEPEPQPKPGVAVRIRSRDRGTWYTWQVTLDGIPEKCFWLYAAEDQGGNRWRNPEDAEAHCRKHLGELVDRLFPGGVMLASTHGFSMELQNLNFVRE